MDLLLSVPIASYFFTTSLTSWSTSLNLLFFYMTWSTLVLSHPPMKIEMMGVTASRILLWLVPSLLFLAFDTLVPSLAESIKYGGASALPPRDARLLGRTLGLALLNLALETALEAAVSFGLATALGEPLFQTSTTLPLPWQIIKHIALLFAAREVLTYYIHRYLLHQPQALGRRRGAPQPPRNTRALARLHATYAHARSCPPYSLLAMADHPIPFLLHRFVPLFLPALALRSRIHVLTYLVYVALATLEETLATSGYTVVPGLIMRGMTRRCAIHYSRPAGNFGAFGLLDWLSGTAMGKDVIEDVKDEARKHRLKERGAEAADEAGGILQSGMESIRRSARKRTSKNAAD